MTGIQSVAVLLAVILLGMSATMPGPDINRVLNRIEKFANDYPKVISRVVFPAVFLLFLGGLWSIIAQVSRQ